MKPKINSKILVIILISIKCQVFSQVPSTTLDINSMGEISPRAFRNMSNLNGNLKQVDANRMRVIMAHEKSESQYRINSAMFGGSKTDQSSTTKPNPPGPPKPGNGETDKIPLNPLTLTLKTTLDTNWMAANANDGDVNLAVSRQNVLVTTSTNIVFYDRAGNTLKSVSVNNFFSEFPSILDRFKNASNDTRCIYDHFRRRFWIATQGRRSAMLLAVSKTENPADGFFGFWLPTTLSSGIDYPQLGISEHVFTITNNRSAFMFDADALASNGKPVGVKLSEFKDMNDQPISGRLTPVTQYAGSPYVFIICTKFGTNSIFIYGYKNAPTTSQPTDTWAVNFDNTPYTDTVNLLPPDGCGPQKNSAVRLWFDNLTAMVLSASYRNGNITMALQQGFDYYNDGMDQTAIRIIRVTPLMGKKLLVSVNQILGNSAAITDKKAPRIWPGFPAVSENKNGDVLTCFARTGTSIFPGIAYAGKPSKSSGFSSIVTLKAGEKPFESVGLAKDTGWTMKPPYNYKRFPWADCSGICIDPLDDQSFWIASVYANSQSDLNIGVWVGKVKL